MSSAAQPLGLRRMLARDPAQPFRAASTLELLFDLVFVIAVSRAALMLHELLGAGHVLQGVVAYLMVFFAVWWAWMNFTWFASAFDTDDWAYRLMTIAQMGGVLVLAAGMQEAMTSYDFTRVTWGYVIMRLAMVGQWLRAAASDVHMRRTALTFAAGITIVQVMWLTRVHVLDARWQFMTFFILVGAELAVPMIAERQAATSWHPHHIADRYGCFTLILLGESVAASATGIFQALGQGAHVVTLVGLAAAGLLIAAGMWWLYFRVSQGDLLASTGRGFGFGYAHYLIFAAAGAVSAGIALRVDAAVEPVPGLTEHLAALALSIPVAVFVLAVWALLLRPMVSARSSAVIVVASVAILAAGLIPGMAVLVTVAGLAVVVVVLEVPGSG